MRTLAIGGRYVFLCGWLLLLVLPPWYGGCRAPHTPWEGPHVVWGWVVTAAGGVPMVWWVQGPSHTMGGREGPTHHGRDHNMEGKDSLSLILFCSLYYFLFLK